MIQEATAEKVDLAKRYELFAKAEAWLINEGIVIPFRVFSMVMLQASLPCSMGSILRSVFRSGAIRASMCSRKL